METLGALIFISIPVLFMIGAFVSLLVFVFTIWMVIDCLQKDPKEVQDRNIWLTLLIVGVLTGYGFIASLIYFFTVKRKYDK